MLKRTLLALPLVALLSTSLLVGCDDKKETAAKPQEKILRVGTNPTFAPFEFQGKDAELTGSIWISSEPSASRWVTKLNCTTWHLTA